MSPSPVPCFYRIVGCPLMLTVQHPGLQQLSSAHPGLHILLSSPPGTSLAPESPLQPPQHFPDSSGNPFGCLILEHIPGSRSYSPGSLAHPRLHWLLSSPLGTSQAPESSPQSPGTSRAPESSLQLQHVSPQQGNPCFHNETQIVTKALLEQMER